ncbi:hypothetical protein C8D92_101453 [Tamilnaduibacter salinus]|uniref:PasA protein n=1 Tax=Tamilnaduibacter salinus TaxID=1484056 RepID=A0A2A2I2Z4_9GAMM|nr:DUF6586 family protein [Tamilnaduibacter salinus]PAV25686.1 hypothetical protein CF392_09570 [Tamilnaduibacter salinus]PVY79240.1 hypothetical protein C8D92_101453 [Tamilnaduibacter salinus]
MASEWPSFVRQKVTLASALIDMADEQDVTVRQEAGLQGAVALLRDAQRGLLTLIADFYQKPDQQPQSAAELAECLQQPSPETEELARLEADVGSWWHHIGQLSVRDQRPIARRRPLADRENMIAVSAASEPDRSVTALKDTAEAMLSYLETLVERHAEW